MFKRLSEARLPTERFLGQMDGQVGRVVPSRGRVPPPGLRGEGPATRLACSAPFGAPSLFSILVWLSRRLLNPCQLPSSTLQVPLRLQQAAGFLAGLISRSSVDHFGHPGDEGIDLAGQ